MRLREERLGAAASFLLPSLKLKEPVRGVSLEDRLHNFLMENFGGYTAQAGNIFGYWREQTGDVTYGEHREFTVALAEEGKMPILKTFLARLARELGEDCIYLQSATATFLIYATPENEEGD